MIGPGERGRNMKLHALGLGLFVLAFGAPIAAGADEPVDLKTVHRIKDEAFRNSKVMDHLFSLTDVNGPRLTGSPGWRSAADWAMTSLKGWGIVDAHLEKWGRFGRGWSLQRFSVYAPLHGVPKAWTAGTSGPVSGDVVFAPLFAEKQTGEIWDQETLTTGIRDYASKQKGKLRGKIVLIEPPPNPALPTKPQAERYDDAKLEILAQGPEPEPLPPLEWPLQRLPADREERDKVTDSIPQEVTAEFYLRRRRILDRLSGFLRDEGVTAVLAGDKRGSGGA